MKLKNNLRAISGCLVTADDAKSAVAEAKKQMCDAVGAPNNGYRVAYRVRRSVVLPRGYTVWKCICTPAWKCICTPVWRDPALDKPVPDGMVRAVLVMPEKEPEIVDVKAESIPELFGDIKIPINSDHRLFCVCRKDILGGFLVTTFGSSHFPPDGRLDYRSLDAEEIKYCCELFRLNRPEHRTFKYCCELFRLNRPERRTLTGFPYMFW